MLTWQLSDYFFTMIANFLLGGYTGAISISVSIIHNTLMIKHWDSIYTTVILVIIQVSAGTYFNNLGLIGFLPLISSVSYTIITFMTSKVQWLRCATVVFLRFHHQSLPYFSYGCCYHINDLNSYFKIQFT